MICKKDPSRVLFFCFILILFSAIIHKFLLYITFLIPVFLHMDNGRLGIVVVIPRLLLCYDNIFTRFDTPSASMQRKKIFTAEVKILQPKGC